jgi:kumamolisin
MRRISTDARLITYMSQEQFSTLRSTALTLGLLSGSLLSASAAVTVADHAFLGESVKAIAAQPTSDRNQAYLTRSLLTTEEKAAPVNFEVALKMRNFDDLEARIAKGQRISAQEMASTYEPAAADYQQIESWLTAQGLTITHESQHHLAIFASGSVNQIQKAMSVTFGRVTFQDEEFTSALTAPSVPAWVSAKLVGVNGLQPQFRPRKHIVKADPDIITAGGIIYSPAQIAAAYDATALYNSNLTGSGQTIAIIIDTFPLASDLALFWKNLGVKQSLSNIQFIQAVPGTLPPPEGEESLDTEWSSSMAPNAKVRVYATTDLSSVNLDLGYDALLADASDPTLNIHQMSMSYGIPEYLTTLAQATTDDGFFSALTAEGVTCFASSGDSGSTPGPDNTPTGPLGVSAPADSPNVAAVGGTSLVYDTLTNVVNSEVVWNHQAPRIGVAASGGGVSNFFGKPSWQVGNGVDPTAMRQVPDVASSADEFHAATVYLQGVIFPVGGTSWSSPTWAGLCALMNQAREDSGFADLGLLAPHLYPLIGTSSFRDITVGDNATPTSNKLWKATVGYDKATGIGSPLVQALTQQLILSTNLVGITPSASVVQVQPGQPATFTVGVSGGAATYQWQEEDLGFATWNNLTDGTPYSGTATNTLTVNPTTTAMSGQQYRCVVTLFNPITTTPSILIVDTSLTISTYSGVPGSPGLVNGSAGKSEFKSPAGVAVDGAGNVYVADSGNNAIRMITPAGVVTEPYGSTRGTAGFAEGTGNNATFNNPVGLTIDPLGNIYVADKGNGVIRKISGGIVTQFVASPITSPSAITSDSLGNIYVADSALGQVYQISPFAVFTLVASGLNHPNGVAIDSNGNIYITEGANFDVVEVSGGAQFVVAGQTGEQGYQDGIPDGALFNAPAGVCVDDQGNVYITDSQPIVPGNKGSGGNNVIRKLSTIGVVSTVAGTAGASGSANGLGAAAQFNCPVGIAFGGAGNFYIADTSNHAIRQGSLGNKIGATVTLSNLTVPYTGSPQAVTVTTNPTNLPVSISYNGSPVAPTFAGSYAVVVSVNDITYSGTATATMMIGTAPTIPPIVSTGTATVITGTTALLSETVNPQGSSTSGYFQYGTTTAYGSTSSTTVISSGTTNIVSTNTVTFPQAIAPVIYHFRAVAFNQAGIVYGADRTFTALPSPTLTTGATPYFSATGAEVSAAVNPNGQKVTVYINYGTTNALGSITGSQTITGLSPVNVYLTFPGLDPNTTYFYQIVMTGPAGTFFGPVLTFTTLGFDTVVVASSGQAAPGTASTFASFGPPAINDIDGGAFNATLTLAGGVTSSSKVGIWADDTGGTLDLIAQTGSNAPGTAALFQALSDPVYNNPASVAFVGTTSARTTGIWTDDNGGTLGSLGLVALQGAAAPATTGNFATFGSLGLTDTGGPIFYATISGTGVNSTNNAGIWLGDTAQHLLFQLGQTVSGKTITKLTFMPSLLYVNGQTRSFNSFGDLACLATFSDKTTGFVEDLIGVLGVQTFTGSPADSVSGATYASFGNPAINDNDAIAYAATISGTGITNVNNTGIWADDGLGNRLVVARTGTGVAPGTTALFTGFSDPVLNVNEAVAFRGTLKVASGQATASNNIGIWATSSNLTSLSLVAQLGAQAPGCPTGAVFASFSSLGLPDVGGAVFFATLQAGAGGVTSANNTGIWAVDDTGTLQLIVRTGDVLTGKTVTSLVFLPSPASVTGATRSFSAQLGDLTYLVTFSDKSTAVFGVVFP